MNLTLLELLEEVEAALNHLPNKRYRNSQGVMRTTYDLVKEVEAHRKQETANASVGRWG